MSYEIEVSNLNGDIRKKIKFIHQVVDCATARGWPACHCMLTRSDQVQVMDAKIQGENI